MDYYCHRPQHIIICLQKSDQHCVRRHRQYSSLDEEEHGQAVNLLPPLVQVAKKTESWQANSMDYNLPSL
jgi:hypothetical protein